MRAWIPLVITGLLYAAVLGWAAVALPSDGVPLHFGIDGEADRFGSRAAALWGFGLLGLGMFALFTGLLVAVRRGSLGFVNVPHKDYWTAEERRPQLRRMVATTDLAVLGSATMALLGAVIVATVSATGGQARLPPAFLAVFGLYLVVVLGWSTWLARRRYRPSDTS
ncbi:DUF1648 domain-containing protein [Pseudonocardia nigra]|uniref:DUF1648 domain-containing protein n=1 Tax=Pseudonocardia nigra TaxID=1921578 RepID=UPI001C5D143B|nr:DUF1648 domain-containing protein [Pseudonocardia nigra]